MATDRKNPMCFSCLDNTSGRVDVYQGTKWQNKKLDELLPQLLSVEHIEMLRKSSLGVCKSCLTKVAQCSQHNYSNEAGHSPIHSSQNAPLYMEASPKFALYLYQILDGFMGSYRPIKQWKVYIMWQHREDMPIWGVKVRKSDSHCSMLSVLLGDNKRIKVLDNLSKCSGMCQKCVKVL